MSHLDLDNYIYDVQREEDDPLTSATARMFFYGMQKMAMDSPAELIGPTLAPSPEQGPAVDVHPEEFLVPLGQVVPTLAQCISTAFKLHTCYTYYGEVVRGTSRGDFSSSLSCYTYDVLRVAKYLLRRASSLTGASIQIPASPMPDPISDPASIIQSLLSCEQQLAVMLKALRTQVGNSPMKHTLMEMLNSAERRTDELKLRLPGIAAETAPDLAAKMASAMKIAHMKLAIDIPQPAQGDVVVPEPGMESQAQYLAREKELEAAQSANENQFLRQQNQQLQQHATDVQVQADQLNEQVQQQAAQVQQGQAENQQLQQQVQGAQMQAQQGMEMASQASSQAAAQADAKMRLSMRIQQLRQNLSNIVSQDPAAEEGAAPQEEAGPGMAQTQVQQQQQAEQQQAEQQAQAAQDPNAQQQPQQSAAAVKEEQEAQRTAVQAEQQAVQADEQVQADQVKQQQQPAPEQ